MYFYIYQYYFFSDSSNRSGWDGKCSEARELLQGKTLISHDCIDSSNIWAGTQGLHDCIGRLYRKWSINCLGAYFIFPVTGGALIQERRLFQPQFMPFWMFTWYQIDFCAGTDSLIHDVVWTSQPYYCHEWLCASISRNIIRRNWIWYCRGHFVFFPLLAPFIHLSPAYSCKYQVKFHCRAQEPGTLYNPISRKLLLSGPLQEKTLYMYSLLSLTSVKQTLRDGASLSLLPLFDSL